MDPGRLDAELEPTISEPNKSWPWIPLLSKLEGRMVWRTEWVEYFVIPLLVVTLVLRLLWLNVPDESIIFDENYYVNASRVILGWEVAEGRPYAEAPAGIDPNTEHLPLGKLMIAGSMHLFGDGPLGWRLPSVIFGTMAVGLLYLLVRRLTNRPGLALFAALILSFDNLAFVHGRIATLDMPMVALMMLGFYLYVIGRPGAAGVALALSTLAKITGLVGLPIIFAYEAWRFVAQRPSRMKWRRAATDLLLVLGVFLLAFMLLLWPMDVYFTTYPSPIEHMQHLLSYGVKLANEGTPQGIASHPWQWLVNEEAITYYQVDVNQMVDGEVVSTRPSIKFLGQMNMYIIALLPLALAYLVVSALRRRDEFSILLLVIIAGTYLQPFLLALLFHRISYIFYFLPVLPALCAGIAYFLLDHRLPRLVPVFYGLAVLFGFLALFPFRVVP